MKQHLIDRKRKQAIRFFKMSRTWPPTSFCLSDAVAASLVHLFVWVNPFSKHIKSGSESILIVFLSFSLLLSPFLFLVLTFLSAVSSAGSYDYDWAANCPFRSSSNCVSSLFNCRQQHDHHHDRHHIRPVAFVTPIPKKDVHRLLQLHQLRAAQHSSRSLSLPLSLSLLSSFSNYSDVFISI